MILLDTNVVSELMRATPAPPVVAWFDLQPSSLLYLSAVAKAEIETGIAILPGGKRRDALKLAADAVLKEFQDRCLSLDCTAASTYAQILAVSKQRGRPMTLEDAQIASIALANGLKLATRNRQDFDFLEDLALIDPWEPQ